MPQTAQDSIPFERMFTDGICRVKEGYYTKTVQFQDINYHLAQKEDRMEMFSEWASFLNFFDSSIHFELSFLNRCAAEEQFERVVQIEDTEDGYDELRHEYSGMLKRQLMKGNNGLVKEKYLTFAIEAESMKQAKPRLEHIENDILNNFRHLGVMARSLNGKERLEVMHDMFHINEDDIFQFEWSDLVPSGMSVKDFIAPTSFAFQKGRSFQMGSTYGAVSYLAITAPELNDRVLADFLDMESSQVISIHIQSVDQTAAIKRVKHTITELDRSKIEEQKKAVRAGYDMGATRSLITA